jgi:hypothetical protein
MQPSYTEVPADSLVLGEIYWFIRGNDSTRGQFVGLTQMGENQYAAIVPFGGTVKEYRVDDTHFLRQNNQAVPVLSERLRYYIQRYVAPIQPVSVNAPSTAYLNVPKGSSNTITGDEISQNDAMVNFHGERSLQNPRYYLATTVSSFQKNENPYTRQPLTAANKTYYKARLVGGKGRKSRKQRRKTRKGKN